MYVVRIVDLCIILRRDHNNWLMKLCTFYNFFSQMYVDNLEVLSLT